MRCHLFSLSLHFNPVALQRLFYPDDLSSFFPFTYTPTSLAALSHHLPSLSIPTSAQSTVYRSSIFYAVSLFLSHLLFFSLTTSYVPALPAREQLSDFSPAVAQLLMGLVDDSVLLLSP